MNIRVGQPVGGLFERIEYAYQEGKLSEAQAELSGADKGSEAAKRPAAVAPGGACDAPPSAESWAHLENPVQRGLLELCSDAINGRFQSEDELRNSVVQTIFENRYREPLAADQAEQIMQTLRATLATDPSFREGVEHLLMLAARELA